MARIIKGKVNIKDVHIDLDVYPRTATFWQNIYKYSENMKSGSKFPPIVLAKYKGMNVLVDGRHRLEAVKLLKGDRIEAELHTGWDKKRIFEESIRRNISHGLSLSPYEIRKIILKLKLMRYSQSQISGLVGIQIGKLEKFIAERAVNAITGKEIHQVIVKAPLKHLAGGTYNQEQMLVIENSQDILTAKNQIHILEQTLMLMEQNLIDTSNPKIQELLDRIKEVIKSI